MKPAVISVEQLTKYYGQTVGVEQISFSVDEGDVFGFLGPNGAGKTTTIRLLLGLLHATRGSISVFGRPIPKDSWEIRRRCGYLPGNFTGYGHMTVEEFLRFAASIRGTRPTLQAPLLERFGLLEDDLSKRIKHLSHGTRQKLGIVQAFFHNPELVILDEPTIGLDPLMQEEFYKLLREIQNDGCTIFMSSHILPEVEKTCDRVGIIREGKLVALETLDGLRKRRYRRLILTLRHPLESLELPGSRLVKHLGLRYEFLFKGDIDTLLNAMASLPVADFAFPEPDLEEVFMAYYRAEGDA